MNILIDADGCPVVDLTLQIAKRFGVPVIILCTPLTKSSGKVRRRWCSTKERTAALFSSSPSSRKKGTSLS